MTLNNFDDFYPPTSRCLPIQRDVAPTTVTTENQSALVCLSDVKRENVNWLWCPFIPFSKVTIIEGDPGLGKSHITLTLAAAVSLGGILPTGENCEEGNVLLLSAEDGLADTIKPRLETFGANTDKIFAPRETFSLDDEGLLKLDALMQEIAPKLVIIDPIVAYLGGKVDMNKAQSGTPIYGCLSWLRL